MTARMRRRNAKCGAPKEKFEKLTDDSARLIDKSRFTNLLHQRLASALDELTAISDKGIADNLDPELRGYL